MRLRVGRERGHAEAELLRLRQGAEHPRVPLAVAVVATVLLVVWGNGVVLLGRRLDAPDAVTLAAHPALALGVTVLLLKLGWAPGTLGLRRPAPQPSSRRLQVLIGALALAGIAASAVVLAVDPSKRLEIIRLVVGTAMGEEVLHRSALLAVWTSAPVSSAVTTAVCVAAFGAWHVAGAVDGGAFSPLEVAVPAIGTLLFLWVRLRYRSVAAPTVLHLATNLPGLVVNGWGG